MNEKTIYDVIIVGGGTGGIMAAARMRRKNKSISIALIEPRTEHWYQPAWTLVGAGKYKFYNTLRQEKNLIPDNVEWIRDYVTEFLPLENQLLLKNGTRMQYRYLIISAGIQSNIDELPGLREALKTDKVCSNYLDPQKTFRVLQNFKGGNAVFTQPSTPIRCGGAPQKIMYLAEEYFRKHGIRNKTNVFFITPGTVIFGVKIFAEALNKIISDRNILFQTLLTPIRIDHEKQLIFFRFNNQTGNSGSEKYVLKHGEFFDKEGHLVVPYEMLHLAPPQSAPGFIQQSPFAYQEGPNKGWMEVDKFKLNHPVFKNVYGIGDCVALPTAKTGAAIRKQAPVVVEAIYNKLMNQAESEETYNGYSSCPIVTGYNQMLLCEFKYDNIRDTDPILGKFVDTTKPKRSMWYLKKYLLPWLYWNMMLKGKI